MKKITLFLLWLLLCVNVMAGLYKVGERKNTFATGDKVFIYSTCMVNTDKSRCGIIKNSGTDAAFEPVVPNADYTNDGNGVWTVEVLETTNEYTKVAFKTISGTYWGIGGKTNNATISTNQTFYLVNYTSDNWNAGASVLTVGTTSIGEWPGGDVLGQDENFAAVAPADLTLEHKLYAAVAGNGKSINTNNGTYQTGLPVAYPIAFYEAEEIKTLNLEEEPLTTGYYFIENTNTSKTGRFIYSDGNSVKTSTNVDIDNPNYIWHVNVYEDGTFYISTPGKKYWPLPTIGNISMTTIAPEQKLKYSTDNDSYTSGTPVVDGTGSCLIYSDATKITNTQYTTSYFHMNDSASNNNGKYVASWYNTDPGSLLYAKFLKIADAEPITALNQLDNTSVYTIVPSSVASAGAICAKEGDETKLYITYRSGAAVNPFDPYQQFAIFECAGKYFLYNVGAQKFVKKSAGGTALTESVTISNEFTFESSNETPDQNHNYVQADYPWCIVFERYPLCATTSNDYSGNGGLVTNWDHNGDNGTVLALTKVETDVASLADAYAKVEEYVYAATTVTYKYMYNGEELGSAVVDAVFGSEYPAATNVPVGYTATLPTGNVAGLNQEVEIELTFTGYPFEFSETVENIEHWYYIQIHSNNKKYIQYLDGQNYLEWADAEVTPQEEDLYTWAFVGSREQGFKLVNFALGTEYALATNGNSVPAMVAFADATNLKPANSRETGNAEYFCLQYPGSNYLNGQSGKIAMYSENDAGSTMIVTERVIEERNINIDVIVSGNGAVSIKGKVGTSAKFAQGDNVTVMATADNKYIFKEWLMDGARVGTDVNYSFVADESRSLTAVFVPKLEQTVIFDFTGTDWGIPTLESTGDVGGVKTANDYTHVDGKYIVRIDPTAADGGSYYSDDYLCMQKTGTKIVLPAFDFEVSRIEIVGHQKAADYPNADMNVYVGDNAVSDACVGFAGTTVFEIAETAQAAGNSYELKIGGNGGMYSSVICISYIKIYPKNGLVAPQFSVQPGVYTEPFELTLSTPTASVENVENVKYIYMKSGADANVDYTEAEGPITIDATCYIEACVQLDYYGITYTSESTSAEYIMSDYVAAQKLYAPEPGSVFISVNGKSAMPIATNDKNFLQSVDVTGEGNCIKVAEYYAYTLEEQGTGYLLKDGNGLYLAANGTGTDFITATNVPATNVAMYTWNVAIDETGAATISNNGKVIVYEGGKFALRTSAGTAVLPNLYGRVLASVPVKFNSIEGAKLISGFDKNGMATFSAPFSTVLPDGVTAYYALEESVGSYYISLVQYTGTELPANEGFILVGDVGTVSIPVSTEEIEGLGGTNKMGNTAAGEKVLTAGECYLLGGGADGPGFYACAGGTLAQYKAYLNVRATGASRSVVIRFQGTTGIDDVVVENNGNDAIYDLSGRRVYNPKHGIYIVNGKKIIIK